MPFKPINEILNRPLFTRSKKYFSEIPFNAINRILNSPLFTRSKKYFSVIPLIAIKLSNQTLEKKAKINFKLRKLRNGIMEVKRTKFLQTAAPPLLAVENIIDGSR